MGVGMSAGRGGDPYGTPTIVPLHFGSGGGGGGGLSPGGIGGVGGNGGGALAILSLGPVVISGRIDVSGLDGRPAGGASTAPAGGGGGGSGGSLLLSGSDVTLDAGHDLLAVGGKGGPPVMGGGAGGDGSDGRIWIGGGAVNISGGTPRAMPQAVVGAGTVVTTFPR
jgi:hypothetical protein